MENEMESMQVQIDNLYSALAELIIQHTQLVESHLYLQTSVLAILGALNNLDCQECITFKPTLN